MLLFFTGEDIAVEKKNGPIINFSFEFFLLELHLVIKPDKLNLLTFVIATGNPNAVSANKIISYLPVFPKSL